MGIKVRLNEPTQIKDSSTKSYLNELIRKVRQGFDSAVNERERQYTTACVATTSINPPGAASDPDMDTVNGTYLFDGTKTELIFYTVLLPSEYVPGSDIYPGMRWQKTTSTVGNVLWEVGYKKAKLGEVMDASFTTLTSTTTHTSTPDTNTAEETLVTFMDSEIDGSDLSPGDSLVFRVSRIGGDALDTYPDDVRCLGCGFVYLKGRAPHSVFGFGG